MDLGPRLPGEGSKIQCHLDSWAPGVPLIRVTSCKFQVSNFRLSFIFKIVYSSRCEPKATVSDLNLKLGT